MFRRIAVVVMTAVALLGVGAAPAWADRAAQIDGPNGSAGAVINVAPPASYRVDYNAVDFSPDNLFTVTELTVVDPQGARTFRNVNRGGDIADFEVFPNRGPATVSIVFTFQRAFGETEFNRANPLVVTYP